MIVNAAVSPFADERRNSAMADMFLPDGTLLRSFEPQEVLEVSLVQELYKHQTGIPRCEISITVDNSSNYFDVSNAESAIYSLTAKSYCEAYLSSVAYGSENAYVKKCRYFFDSFEERAGTATLKYTDAVSHFDDKKMVYAFAEIGVSGSANALEILEGVKLETGYDIEYSVPDEIRDKMNFAKSSFMTDTDADSIKTGLFDMASRLTKSFGSPVYLMIEDEGTLTFKKQQTTVLASILSKHFKSCEIVQGKDCLISKISDRGNILYQLGDIIEVSMGGKNFNTEIYRIHYRLSKEGGLSSEWEGVIL